MTIWRGILRNNESDKRLPESPLKVINFGEDELAALQSVKTGVRMYIYCEGDELVRLCIVVNSFLKKNLIPEIVFSSKEDRDLFFKYFYNSAIAGQDIPCRTRDGRYVVAEFPGAPDRAWSGLRDTDKTIFDKLAGMLKVYIKPKLISYWEEEHQDQIDVVVYLKTISKDSDRDGLPYYSDYEDRYLKNYDTSPVIMLVKDEKALPRPEKVVYSKANIITLVNGITMTAPKTVDEFSLGLPKIKLGSVDESFFINLKFGEKREFVRLFLKLIWSRFAKFSGFKLPDEVDRMRFSAEVSKRNKMVDTFFETEKCITEYFMGNFNEIKTLLNNRQDVLLNIGLDEISKLSSIQQITFLPEDKLFQDVFFFIFGKEIFYLKIRGHDFDWLQNNIRQIAKELSVTGKGDDDIENSDKNRLYEEKLDLPEQYGTDNTKEIECKKIILERDSQAVSIFVPIGSKAMLEKVTRDGAEEKGIKYTDLQPGDVFEKDYWTY